MLSKWFIIDWPVLLLFRFGSIVILWPGIVVSVMFPLFHAIRSLLIMPVRIHSFPCHCAFLRWWRLEGVYPFWDIWCRGQSGRISLICLEWGHGGCQSGSLWWDPRKGTHLGRRQWCNWCWGNWHKLTAQSSLAENRTLTIDCLPCY